MKNTNEAKDVLKTNKWRFWIPYKFSAIINN